MKIQTLFIFVLWISCSGIDSSVAQNQHLAEAKMLFQKQCISCHQAPDLSLPTDQAWLKQVTFTA